MLPTASIPPLLSLQYLLQNGSSIPMLLLLPPQSLHFSLSSIYTNLVHPSPAAVAPQLYRLHPSTSLSPVSTNLVHLSPCCCCPSSLPPPSLHFFLSSIYQHGPSIPLLLLFLPLISFLLQFINTLRNKITGTC